MRNQICLIWICMTHPSSPNERLIKRKKKKYMQYCFLMGSPLKSLALYGADCCPLSGQRQTELLENVPDQIDFTERSFLPLIRILSCINAIIWARLCLCQNSAKSITTPSRTNKAQINQNIMRFRKFGLGKAPDSTRVK